MNLSIMGKFADLIIPIPIELDHKLMILKQTAPMRHRKQRNPQLLRPLIQFRLHIHTHRRRTLVQYREDRSMVEESSHRYPLLLSPRKNVLPVIDRIESFLSLLDVVQLDPVEKLSELFVRSGDAFLGMGVDDLVAECTGREVGTLGYVEKLVHVWSFEYASSEGP